MWAKLHQHWTVNDWKNVLFSDESHFEVHGHRVSYVRKGSKKVTAAHLQQAAKYPPKVMFWGCFTHEGPGALIPIKGMMNSDKYIHLLKTRIIPQLLVGDEMLLHIRIISVRKKHGGLDLEMRLIRKKYILPVMHCPVLK